MIPISISAMNTLHNNNIYGLGSEPNLLNKGYNNPNIYIVMLNNQYII